MVAKTKKILNPQDVIKSFLNSCEDSEDMRAYVIRSKSGKTITHFGILIHWSRKDMGFGEIDLRYNMKTQSWSYDTECMGPKFVSEIFNALNKHFDFMDQLKASFITSVEENKKNDKTKPKPKRTRKA